MLRSIIIVACLLLQPLSGIAATVLEIQGMLRDLGYTPGTVDGRWGGKSREALKHFQADRALPATGKMNAQTEHALQMSVSILTVPPSTSTDTQPPQTQASPPANAPHYTPQQETLNPSLVVPTASKAPEAKVTPPSTKPSTLPYLVPNSPATPPPPPPTQAPPVQSDESVATNNTRSHANDAHTDGLRAGDKKGKATPKAISTTETAAAAISVVTSPAGIRFVHIPGGCFAMGGGTEYQHEICVHANSSFWIGQYEVTQGQWQAITGHNPSVNAHDANYPVENISWNDAHDFISQLNAKGLGRYRLPTEAEWEYSARAGTSAKYWWGDNPPVCDPEQINGANFQGGPKCPNTTMPVGTYKSNPFGIYDVHGNVWEWVEDLYLPDAYEHSPKNDPVITEGGTDRVFRGGSWLYPAEAMTVFHRDHAPPEFQFSHLGLRLIYEP